LLNTNESASVFISQKFSELNKAEESVLLMRQQPSIKHADETLIYHPSHYFSLPLAATPKHQTPHKSIQASLVAHGLMED
jgi:hypothetical protein